MPLVTSIGKQKQADLYDYLASLIYIVSSRPVGVIRWDPTLKQQKQKQNEKLQNLPLYSVSMFKCMSIKILMFGFKLAK